MKKALFLLTFIIACLSLQAQEKTDYGTPEERAEKMTTEMEKALPLTKEQVPEIEALNLKYAQIIQDEVLDKDLSMFGKYKKIRSINKKKEKELKPLLSEAQYENYDQLKAEQSKKMMAKFF